MTMQTRQWTRWHKEVRMHTQQSRQHGRLVAAREITRKEKTMKIASLLLTVFFALVSSDVVFADDCNQVGKFKVKFTSVEHSGFNFVDKINNFRGFLCSDATTEVDGKLEFLQSGPVTSNFPVPLDMTLEFRPVTGNWFTNGAKIEIVTDIVPTGAFEEFLLDNFGPDGLIGWSFSFNIPISEHADLILMEMVLLMLE